MKKASLLILIFVFLNFLSCKSEVRVTDDKSSDEFDVCINPFDGDESNGFVYKLQVDVGRTEESGGDEEPIQSTFELDRPYDSTSGFGYAGIPGEAGMDPGWTASAWPYGGQGEKNIHLSTRQGMESYRFDVPNGTYAVTWHFIEKTQHWSGFRSFDLEVQGEVAHQNFDIFKEVGNRFMTRMRAIAKVENRRLDLGFKTTGTAHPPIVSAIEIETIDPDTNPPEKVKNVLVRGGYSQAILTWDELSNADLRGYNIWRSGSSKGPWKRVNHRIVTVNHFVDHSAISGETYYYRIIAQDLFCNDSSKEISNPVTILSHKNSTLGVFEIEITDEALKELTKNVSSDTYVGAILHLDGVPYAIEIRNRGASTRYLSKPNFKIRLQNDIIINGRNGFKLNSEVVDPMMINEKLAYDLFGQSSALAPEASYVHVVLANRYMGVYTEIQEVDKLFFADNQIYNNGNLYRLGTGMLNILENEGDYANIYEKKTNESDPAGYLDLTQMIKTLNRTAEHEYADWFDNTFASDEYVDFLVVNSLVANYDMVDGNQYIYHDTLTDTWHHVPWDYNNGTFTDVFLPPAAVTFYQAGISNPWWFTSMTRCFNNTELRGRILARYRELMGSTLSLDNIINIVEAAVKSAETDVLLDPWMVAWKRDKSYKNEVVTYVIDFFERRYDVLSDSLESYASIGGPLVINEFQVLNTGINIDDHGDADPWIELYNRGEELVNLGGLCITDNPRDEENNHCFEDGLTIAPGDFLILWADGEPDEGKNHMGFTLNESGGIIALSGMSEDEEIEERGSIDIVFYGTQTSGESFGRVENGSDNWIPITVPTPGN